MNMDVLSERDSGDLLCNYWGNKVTYFLLNFTTKYWEYIGYFYIMYIWGNILYNDGNKDFSN